MEKQRTSQQNKSLHLFCKLLAEELNDHGITQPLFLKDFSIDNTPESVKGVFRDIGWQKFMANSTAKLTTKEITEIYDEINRQVSKFGIYIAWPSEEEISKNKEYNL